MRILNKINHFERDPKAALLIEIEKIVDPEKRDKYEDLREKVLSNQIQGINEIIGCAENIANPEKKHCIDNLRFLFDDNNSMDKKLLSLVELQKASEN